MRRTRTSTNERQESCLPRRNVTRGGASAAVVAFGLMAVGVLLAAESAAEKSAAGGDKPAQEAAKGIELFTTHVREILAHNCLKCHGGKKTEGEFDLTTREALLHGGSEGAAVVPGNAQESRLYKLIAHAEEPHMPDSAPKLPDTEIASIAAWINAGAPYDKPLTDEGAKKGRSTVTDADRKFWSFQPLAENAPPKVANQTWCRTPIDRFIAAGLESVGLAPNPVVDRRKLIRRAYFDLLGLPPTPEEIEAFLHDPAPDAYEKLIDRLLDSPHYGERWGRHWLDLARFAESHGYEQDYDRPTAFHYRDFVIRALNQDMPFDRFVKLQLAGDEFEPINPEAMIATGFLGAGTHATQITANQVEKERYDELDDMAATVGTAMLGLTIGCARCHDHKFDPIPQSDYYRLLSTFTTTVRSEISLDLRPDRIVPKRAAFEREHAPLAEALARFEREQLPAMLNPWLASNPPPAQPPWMVLTMTSTTSAAGATFTRQEDGSYLIAGGNGTPETYQFECTTPFEKITAVRLEALKHPSLPHGGPGWPRGSQFDLSDFRVSAAPLDGSVKTVGVKLVRLRATAEHKDSPITAAIDSEKKTAWSAGPDNNERQAAIFEFEAPVGFKGGTRLTFALQFAKEPEYNSIGRPRLSISTRPDPQPFESEDVSQELVVATNRALQIPPARMTDADKAVLLGWYRTIDPTWQNLHRAVVEHSRRAPKPELTKVMVTSEGFPAVRLHTQGADFLEKTHFLKRGDLNQKLGEAAQGFLTVLERAPQQESRWQTPPPAGWRTSYRRRALAQWITDVDAGAGPLLARVIANHLWQHHLGRGIVSTPSDFGAQGERPTHPELLDWLARNLVSEGWRLKSLHKLIMTSAVYMQGSEFHERGTAADRDNRLLWRREPRRLEGEAVRDAMLAISGMLDATMYGPGSLDEAQKRRSIYFTIKRSHLIPLMVLFDGPDSLQSLGLRASTTVAPQALALVNNPQVAGYARGFASRLLPKAASSLEDAVRLGSVLALARPPADDELADEVAFVRRQMESYKAGGKENALELALADYCQALMCLNEFIFID